MSQSGWQIAKHHAWAQFGRHFWRWFVFGPLIFKAAITLITITGLVLGGMYVWDHAPEWAEVIRDWLAYLGTYVGLIVAFGISLMVYAIAAFLVWRVWGWLLESYGVTRQRYTISCTTLVIVIGFIIGVTL